VKIYVNLLKINRKFYILLKGELSKQSKNSNLTQLSDGLPCINYNDNNKIYLKIDQENEKYARKLPNEENIGSFVVKLPPLIEERDAFESKIIKLPENFNYINSNDDVIYDENLSFRIRNNSIQSQSHRKSRKASFNNSIIS